MVDLILAQFSPDWYLIKTETWQAMRRLSRRKGGGETWGWNLLQQPSIASQPRVYYSGIDKIPPLPRYSKHGISRYSKHGVSKVAVLSTTIEAAFTYAPLRIPEQRQATAHWARSKVKKLKEGFKCQLDTIRDSSRIPYIMRRCVRLTAGSCCGASWLPITCSPLLGNTKTSLWGYQRLFRPGKRDILLPHS